MKIKIGCSKWKWIFYQVKNKNSVRMSETRMSTVRKINLLKPIPKHTHGCECKTEP